MFQQGSRPGTVSTVQQGTGPELEKVKITGNTVPLTPASFGGKWKGYRGDALLPYLNDLNSKYDPSLDMKMWLISRTSWGRRRKILGGLPVCRPVGVTLPFMEVVLPPKKSVLIILFLVNVEKYFSCLSSCVLASYYAWGSRSSIYRAV